LGNILSQADRSLVHRALSDAFVDNEVDYSDIAKRIKAFDSKIVEHIFFYEVAPVCHSNLETPVPPIWTGFDNEWLDLEIEKLLASRSKSHFQRFKQNLLITTLKWKYADTWNAIKNSG
jgi:hypothetical protein